MKTKLKKIKENKVLSNVLKCVIVIIVATLIMFSVVIFKAYRRIGKYPVTKAYDDLTFTEKIAAKISPYEFETKEQLIKEGLIYNDEMEIGSKIMEMVDSVISNSSTDDSENTDIKIEETKKTLKKLQSYYKKGKINTNGLTNLYNDSYDMISYYKNRLEAYKKIDAYAYEEYSDKYISILSDIKIDFEKIGFEFKDIED